jgi:hypothetical protein
MSAIHIPYRTLSKLEELITSDQGARFRTLSRNTLPLCEDAYRGEKTPFREHLGASVIGHNCSRELWYIFRWVKDPRFSGNTLRLFNRGHLEEGRFVALLLMLGCEVWQHNSSGEQFRVVDHNGHFGGSLDCVLRGIVEWPDVAMLGEFKTHGDKSFVKLAGDDWDAHLAAPNKVPFSGEGVRTTKFEHFVQMQTYMGKMGLPCALYLAVNKNTDSVYAELVMFDSAVFEAFRARARDIVYSNVPLARVKNDPTWWQCKSCNMRSVCWDKAAPERNCRTCEHSRTITNGSWECRKIDEPDSPVLDKEAQLRACPHYSLLPSLQ